jgi:phosphoribosylaminoimidazole-succinocarboxamide synthase
LATSSLYRGKVRDCYWRDDWGAIVTTDRISAFDQVFPQQIPRKGEVLQALAVHFLELAESIVPTHLLEVPDPNVMIVRRTQPLPLEFVLRGYLTGSAWRDYQAGRLQEHYNLVLPAGMQEHQKLDIPLITPTTKEESGHDRPLSVEQAARRIEVDWQEVESILHALYRQGSEWAEQHGLILADCKYELGLYQGKLMLIDELHTPDSSRYWAQDHMQLSKEFFRQWLLEQGATDVIDIPPEIVQEISRRYLELHQRLLGRPLPPAPEADHIQTTLQKRGLI